MRNTSKATTLENRFPLLAVEHGCIVSKDADITAAFEVELPELYTVTAAEYEMIHGCWCKAVKVLPYFSIVHKQDWFIRETYKPDLQKEDMSFLSRSFERHFNERPYLKHTCYLYLTKTTKERSRMQSNFSTLCRGHIVPKEADGETAEKFLEAVEQFARIMNDSGFVRLRRLGGDEIVGGDGSPGLIERYLSLQSEDGIATLQDIDLCAREMRIGDNHLCLHTLSDAEDLPGKVSTDMRYERLSTDRSDCRLSFASPVGLLLPCNHIYNQYILIDNSEENLQRFEKSARNMQSLSRYSRSNSINRRVDRPVPERSPFLRADIRTCPLQRHGVERRCGGAEAYQERCGQPAGKHAVRAAPQYRGLPDALLGGDTGQRGGLPGGRELLHIHRTGTVPLHRRDKLPQLAFALRHQDGGPAHGQASASGHLRPADERGVTTNRNKFVLGPSGSGKSFFMNHLVRQYYEQGTHVVLVDTGNSYQGCAR
jgi:hypothetical protein